MVHTPHNWVIVKLPNNVGYKVLAGWSGGYLDGDMWRLNSGIKAFSTSENYITFHGFSGSVYKCAKACEYIRQNIAHVLGRLESHGAEHMSFEEFQEEFSQKLE